MKEMFCKECLARVPDTYWRILSSFHGCLMQWKTDINLISECVLGSGAGELWIWRAEFRSSLI